MDSEFKEFKEFAKSNSFILEYYIKELKRTKLNKRQKEIVKNIAINIDSYKLLSQSFDYNI